MSFDVKNFEQDVLARSLTVPVLVDFWAEWCAPCRVLTPILERLEKQNTGKFVLAKLNTEDHPSVAADYRVQGIPNVKLFFDGKIVAEFVGALPEYAVNQWLKKNLPSKLQGRIEAARALVAEHRFTEARPELAEILREEPDNAEMKALLAKTYLFDDRQIALELVRDVDEPKLSDVIESVRTIAHLLDINENPGMSPESPIKQRYLAAANYVGTKDFDSALEIFIDIIRSDRNYDEDGSRKACIAIFKYLGEDHPVTLKHRREFGSALYL